MHAEDKQTSERAALAVKCPKCDLPMAYAEAGAVVQLCFDSNDSRYDPFGANSASGSLYECSKCGRRVVLLN